MLTTWTAVLGLATVWMASGARGDDILQTVGFTNCDPNSAITINKADIRYSNDAKELRFDVQGTSASTQKVMAHLSVAAYGSTVFEREFNPCDPATLVQQLCPVPQGNYVANGTLPIPPELASQVPDIAFRVPDIAALASLELVSAEDDDNNSNNSKGAVVACVRGQVSNGKTTSSPAVSFVAAGLAGVALLASGVSAVGAALVAGGGAGGGVASSGAMGPGTMHPTFGDFVGVMQGVAMTGMLSVSYPPIVRSFTQNFAFSTGLVPWDTVQVAIDDFRGSTGGNLTRSSVALLRNTTLVFPDGSTVDAKVNTDVANSPNNSSSSSNVKRALDSFAHLLHRQIDLSVNGTDAGNDATATTGTGPTTNDDDSGGIATSIRKSVSGITAMSERLMVPESNTFMTVLLVVAIVIAAIVVGMLLVKVVLEIWALFGNLPARAASLRNGYGGIIARTVTHLILILYGIWVLYSVYQFTRGDSWAAKALAATTLAAFTLLLAWFSWRIFSTARRLQTEDGDTSGLFERKDIWRRYSLFYESYRRGAWWLFVPNMVYLVLRGAILAGLDGNGLAQAVALLVVESVMLLVVAVTRPYERRSGNVINIAILVVRLLSVALLLVFVDQLGMSETTKSISGVVLIVIQSILTGALGILIIWNAFIAMCKENPHRKRRKEMEKLREQDDRLTPLDARNSLLRLDSKVSDYSTTSAPVEANTKTFELGKDVSVSSMPMPAMPAHNASDDSLVSNAAPIGLARAPTLTMSGSELEEGQSERAGYLYEGGYGYAIGNESGNESGVGIAGYRGVGGTTLEQRIEYQRPPYPATKGFMPGPRSF